MSSIKPPEGRGAAAGLPITPEQGAGAAAPAGADFREALSRVEGAAAGQAAQGAPAAQASAAADPVAELARSVQSGALSPQQALDQLVERTVGQVGRGLSEAQRTELAGVLRTALEADPALQGLRDGLGR